MADTGYTNASTSSNDSSVGTVAWNSTDNALVTGDGLGSVFSSGTSYFLKISNFGFSIPTDSTINGIEVSINRRCNVSPNGTKDNIIKIVKSDGTIGTEDKADTVIWWPSTITYKSYGGSSDLWSESWSYTDINDVDFGVVISATASSGIANVEHVRIKVFYTEPVPTASVSPVTTTLSVPTVTATYIQQETASVSPISLTLSIPSTTATYEYQYSATVSPLQTTLNIPTVTANYIQEETASVSPISTTLTIPTTTATFVEEYSASVSPLSLTLSIPEISAIQVFTASASSTSLTLTIPTTTATYEMEWQFPPNPTNSWQTSTPGSTADWEKQSDTSSSWQKQSSGSSDTWVKQTNSQDTWTPQ